LQALGTVFASRDCINPFSTGNLLYTRFTFEVPEHQSYIYKNILYYTAPVTALQIQRSYFSRPRATTLYRTSQYISVLLHIILYIIQDHYTTSLPRASNCRDPAPLQLHQPFFLPREPLSDTHQFTVLFAIPRHYFTYALSIYIIFSYIYKIAHRVSRLRNFLLTGTLPYTGFTFDSPECTAPLLYHSP
jgi:hypothetical protein